MSNRVVNRSCCATHDAQLVADVELARSLLANARGEQTWRLHTRIQWLDWLRKSLERPMPPASADSMHRLVFLASRLDARGFELLGLGE
jgi:hypothetical protein